MALISPIKLIISRKLEENKDFRKRFFRGQADDEIASSIRSLREKRKMRQVDLAAESGMRQSAISRIEQANYSGWSLNTLFRVADALDARLTVAFEPVETVIEHYKEREAEEWQSEQCINFHMSNALESEMRGEDISMNSSSTSAHMYALLTTQA